MRVVELGNIVVGSSLAAVVYAYLNKYILVLPAATPPEIFEYLPRALKLEKLSNVDSRQSFAIWSSLIFELSLGGMIPFGLGVSSMRVSDKKINLVARETLGIEIKYEKCWVFDVEDVTFDNEIVELPSKLYRVVDWMNVRSGMQHGFGYIETSENFVKEVYFYKSARIDGNHNRKDAAVVSYMGADEVELFEYSDTMVKFVMEKIMKLAGLIRPKLEPSFRTARPLHSTKYKDSEKVSFLDYDAEKVLELYG